MPIIAPVIHGARVVVQDLVSVFVPGVSSVANWIGFGGAIAIVGAVVKSVGPAIADTFTGPDNEVREPRTETRTVDQILADLRAREASSRGPQQLLFLAPIIAPQIPAVVDNGNHSVHTPFQQVGNTHIDP